MEPPPPGGVVCCVLCGMRLPAGSSEWAIDAPGYAGAGAVSEEWAIGDRRTTTTRDQQRRRKKVRKLFPLTVDCWAGPPAPRLSPLRRAPRPARPAARARVSESRVRSQAKQCGFNVS